MYVKFGGETRKMYILVFTCLNIRAIHLELLPNMSTKNFLYAFIRFCNLYTVPSVVYSDNANTFLQSLGVIAEAEVENEFTEFLVKNAVRHIKIPLYAAWVGSAWERMIKTIKSCLHKMIGRKHVEYFELISLLSDVQEAINNRPLTYRRDDELLDSVTPNSFLKHSLGRSLLMDGVSGTELVCPNRKDLIRSLEKREDFYQGFKTLFFDEYLLSLREASKDLHQQDWEDVVKCGDIVLIATPNKSRPTWQMGRISELLPGKDDIVRCAKVVRSDRSEGVYSICMLYPLELSVTPYIHEDSINIVNSTRSVPKRAAALQCLEKMRDSGN